MAPRFEHADAETNGLYYYRARMYIPSWGRFMQPDPIGSTGGQNLYAYVTNDPLNLTDPLGQADDNPTQGAPATAVPAPPISAASIAAGGEINYGALDVLGRPTGVTATITENMIGTGTPANPSIMPPGWSGNGVLFNEAQGHLLGAQLGGSGDVAENLVTLQQSPANSPIMKGFENQIRAAIEGGQIVDYSTTPIYNGFNLVPRGITIMGTGSSGFNLYVTVLNPIGR